MKQIKKHPKRLRTFDSADYAYFKDNNPKTFDGHIDKITTSLNVMKDVSDGAKIRLEKGNLDVSLPEVVSSRAKIMREFCRDLKVHVNQFMEHLEKIEVKGEWK